MRAGLVLGVACLLGACETSAPEGKTASPETSKDTAPEADTASEDTGTGDSGSGGVTDPCISQLIDEVAAWPEADTTAELGEVQVCESPLDGPQYVDVGIDFLASTVPDVEHTRGGVAVVDDFDLDGDLDFIVGFREAQTTLYRNTPDGWEIEEMGLSRGLANNTISLADLDGDGRRDLVLPGPPVRQLMNTEEGLIQTDNVTLNRAPYLELAPGDFDGDGDIDLYGLLSIDSWSDDSDARDEILLNDGSGSFTRVDLPGDRAAHKGFDAQIFDWGSDGDQDVWVVNDQGALFGPNVLWQNDDGVMSDGTDACACGIMQAGMGGDVGDYNNDGLPDLYGSATAINALLEGQPDTTFLDVTLVTGASPLDGINTMSWGAIFLDYDNDGREDILVAEGDFWDHGDLVAVRAEMPLDLLRQVPNPDGRPHFEDASAILGDDLLGTWRAVVARDFNGDGILDILATDLIKRPRLYLSEGCTQANWLEVHAPVGSQIDVCADGLRQTRWSSTESSWGGAGIPSVHFGLGDAEAVDRLQIRLPSGELMVLEGLSGRQSVRTSP